MKHLIKNLMTIFVAISMVLCFVGISFAFTFDSKINPSEFTKWNRVSTIQTGPFGGVVILENPDPNAKIKEASLSLYKNNLIEYWYTINGKVYKYEFNDKTENYDLVVPKADPDVTFNWWF